MDQQLFYLEKDHQFWEIKTDVNTTIIRAGKIGKPGRKFAAKKHDTVFKAKQFAVRQVNGKIIQGFQDPNAVVPRAPMIKLLSKRSSLRLRKGQSVKSKQISSSPSANTNNFHQQSYTRQKNIPKLKKDDTVIMNSSNVLKTDSILTPKWRKPPKKQTTIRRKAKEESVLQKSTFIKSNQQRQNTVSKQQSKVSVNKQKQSNVTKQRTESNVIPRWRKPPKKQTIIRKGAKQESLLPKKSVIMSNQQRQKTITKQQTKMINKPDQPNLTKQSNKLINIGRKEAISELQSIDSLPQLVKRRSSWNKPKLFGPDFSMPKLTKYNQ